MKTRNIIVLSCALFSCALLPEAEGAPETALPGFNTADGDHALFSVTTGVGNSAFGPESIRGWLVFALCEHRWQLSHRSWGGHWL